MSRIVFTILTMAVLSVTIPAPMAFGRRARERFRVVSRTRPVVSSGAAIVVTPGSCTRSRTLRAATPSQA